VRRVLVFAGSLAIAGGALAAGLAPKGNLILIGGGDKPRDAMEKFVALAGGPHAKIVAIPTASEEADAGEYYVKLFKQEYGCTDVTFLPIKTKADAMRPDLADVAAGAGGIFFGGGDQVRITSALLGTPVGAAIAAAFARGAVVGGTSAGTACQSDPMITGEGDFTVIRPGAVELKPGFGFFRGVIVDQHFIKRQRENRLFTVVLEHPAMLGVGIDEATAVWVRPDGTFVVLGDGSVMVIDASAAKVTRPPAGGGPIGAHGVEVQLLVRGETFDLGTRKVVPGRELGAAAAPAGRALDDRSRP
jgi:cyanophycinase